MPLSLVEGGFLLFFAAEGMASLAHTTRWFFMVSMAHVATRGSLDGGIATAVRERFERLIALNPRFKLAPFEPFGKCLPEQLHQRG